MAVLYSRRLSFVKGADNNDMVIALQKPPAIKPSHSFGDYLAGFIMVK